jgi:hypothetical protein
MCFKATLVATTILCCSHRDTHGIVMHIICTDLQAGEGAKAFEGDKAVVGQVEHGECAKVCCVGDGTNRVSV